MIKHPLGLLYVIGMALFWAVVATTCVVLVISFYGLIFAGAGAVVILSYRYMGKIVFFSVWPILLGTLVAYKNRKWWFRKLP